MGYLLIRKDIYEGVSSSRSVYDLTFVIIMATDHLSQFDLMDGCIIL